MLSQKLHRSKALIGAAGVYHVASELSLRNLIALPTTRNAPGIDLIVTSLSGSWHANLQVKTSANKVKFWPISERFSDFTAPGNYYAFVRYIEKDVRFEVFLETAERVAQDVRRDADASQARGNKPWAPCWSLPKDEIDIERVRAQWTTFGLGVDG